MSLTVTDAAFPYLVVQQGALDGLKGDRAAWEAAYNAKMAALFADISAVLPERCHQILDVGGGMGGIDALLARHYDGAQVCILDGEADPPIVRRHAETFNDMGVTRDFLAANGVPGFCWNTPDHQVIWRSDLIVSFGSWCFHYPPAVYLDFVKRCCHPGTILILEVRNGRPDWQVELERVFAPASAIHTAEKFTRRVYVPRCLG